jgi:hypothetical protein
MKGLHTLQCPVIPAKSKDPFSLNNASRPKKEFSHASRHARVISVLALTLLLSSLASAQTLTGTVKNSTTGKPAASDDVVLLSLGQGMEEAGRTKTDAKGHFSFKLEAHGPHLIRVIHQEVTYHRMAPPGTTSVAVEVYDVGKKVEGITVVADIMRFQANQGQLEVERTFAVTNNSKPPRTQMNEHNLEFYVPDGATITEAQAMTAGGQPVKSPPVPEDNSKSRYAFLFPLRPGETRFNVVYTVPYTGSANIDPKTVYPLEHFVAIAPKSMTFSAAPGTSYQVAPFPGQPDANVEVASSMKVGEPMAFKLSGEGMLAAPPDEEGQQSQSSSSAQPESRPGGGLGPPIDAPDPLQKYRWQILGGFALLLVVGGVYVASRQQAANRVARSKGKALPSLEEDEDYLAADPPTSRESRSSEARLSDPRSQSQRRSSSMLLEALKEELFELEVEHKQGRISQQEYESAKSALDQTLQRALKRESAKRSSDALSS